MSILITGGAGYIGSHTTVELLNAGFDVVLVDDFSNSSPAVLERLEKITGKKFPFYQGSILDTDFLDKVFTNEDIELVIHFAAFKAVGESVQKPLKYYKNNISVKGVIRNVGGNLILLSPFIFYLCIKFEKLRSIKLCMLTSFLISLSIELIQLFMNILSLSYFSQGETA